MKFRKRELPTSDSLFKVANLFETVKHDCVLRCYKYPDGNMPAEIYGFAVMKRNGSYNNISEGKDLFDLGRHWLKHDMGGFAFWTFAAANPDIWGNNKGSESLTDGKAYDGIGDGKEQGATHVSHIVSHLKQVGLTLKYAEFEAMKRRVRTDAIISIASIIISLAAIAISLYKSYAT